MTTRTTDSAPDDPVSLGNRASPTHSAKAGRQDRLPRLLIIPALVLELLVHVLPVMAGLAVSFFRLDRQHLWDWSSAPFIGLDNYRSGLDLNGPIGSELVASAVRTGLYALLVVAISWLLGLAATVLLAAPFRGRAFLQAFFLIPFAIPAYATVLTWRLMFDRDTGMVNQLLVDDLHLLGARPFWLIGDNAFWAVVIVGIWRMWPVCCRRRCARFPPTFTTLRRSTVQATGNGSGRW